MNVEPHQPNAAPLGTDDQQRWLRYVDTYERLVPLDRHRDGVSDDIVVLTGDASGHVWRHLVDPDGVETWRRPADDAAVAALHRERLSPGTRARIEGGEPNGGPGELSTPTRDNAPSPDSLLAKVRAFTGATAAVHAASDAALTEQAGLDCSPALLGYLYAIEVAVEILPAENAATQLAALLAEAEAGTLDPERLVGELAQLEAGLRDELAMTRLVTLLPAQWRRLTDPSPFGAEVEARFPACAYDIEEAASCLAFRRPTAAVFHCMKILERGLLALGRHAGAPEILGPHRDWSDILAALASTCPASLAPVLSQVKRIRRRWRAPGLFPAEKYTEAEAERVFQSVGAFMRELAARCDERGDAAAVPDRTGRGRGSRCGNSSWRAKVSHPRLCRGGHGKSWMPTCVGMTVVVAARGGGQRLTVVAPAAAAPAVILPAALCGVTRHTRPGHAAATLPTPAAAPMLRRNVRLTPRPRRSRPAARQRADRVADRRQRDVHGAARRHRAGHRAAHHGARASTSRRCT